MSTSVKLILAGAGIVIFFAMTVVLFAPSSVEGDVWQQSLALLASFVGLCAILVLSYRFFSKKKSDPVSVD